MVLRNTWRKLIYCTWIGCLHMGIATPEAWAKAPKPIDNASVLGLWWLDPKHESGLAEIYRSQDGTLSIKYAALFEDDRITPRQDIPIDTHHPNPEKRNISILGADFVTELRLDPKTHMWVNGRVYNYRTGMSYHFRMRMKNSNTLILRGALDAGYIIGQDFQWKRYRPQ